MYGAPARSRPRRLELRERRHVFEEERLVGWQTVKAHSVYN